MIFETVEKMKLAKLTAGQIISTKGYYVAGDGGGASYLVAASQAVDGYGDHALAGGTVALLQSKGNIDIKQYGAAGDGVTDDKAALDAASLAGDTPYLPDGSYLTSDSVSGLVGNFRGDGQISTTDSGTPRPRGKDVVHISSPPTQIAPPSANIVTGFEGDYKTHRTSETLVTGSTTAGDPAISYAGESNYTIIPEVAGSYHLSYYASGVNKSPFSTGARTGWFEDSKHISHAGKGDAWQALWNVVVLANDPSVLKTHGAPTGGQLAGTTSATVDGVVLQNIEMHLHDNGNDTVGKALTFNLSRSNNTAAKNQFWYGMRMQSIGSEKPDAWIQAAGNWVNGVDLTVANDIDRAIVLKDGQRIYYDGVAGQFLGADQWITAEVVVIEDYRENAGNVYQATTAGTTGATPPTHTSGTISDGGVSWERIEEHDFKSFCVSDGGSYTTMVSDVIQTHHKGTLVYAVDADSTILSNRKTIVESLGTSVRSEVASSPLTALDSVVLIDATATSPTFSLASAAAWGTGKAGRVTLKRTGAGGTVTIQRSGADTIVDKTGATVTSFTLAANTTVELVSDGTSAWHILYLV